VTVLLVHLTDVHFRGLEDSVFGKKSALCSALNPFLPDARHVVIAISGDIAQSGVEAEYQLALAFFQDVRARVQSQKQVPVSFVIAPGNHDCDFRGDQESRLAVVNSIGKKGQAVAASVVRASVEVQGAYVAFRNSLETSAGVVFDDPLWRTHQIDVEGFKATFDCLNASWMSTRHEQQGGLMFPFEQYQKSLPNVEGDVRFAILHHPFNWYSQSNYRDFRSFLHRREDFIVTGHEHQSAGRSGDDALDGECVYIEGAALQTADANYSGFNVLEIDLQQRRFKYVPHSWSEGVYVGVELTRGWEEYRALPKRTESGLALTTEFMRVLQDPGATLKHPSGIAVSIDDIYVFPDFETPLEEKGRSNVGKKVGKRSSRLLLDIEKIDGDVLLTGEDACGKTQLLLRLFSHFHSKGMLPVFIKGKDLKSSTRSEVDKVVAAAVKVQYGEKNSLQLAQADLKSKVFLIDDLDESAVKASGRAQLINRLKAMGAKLYVTAGTAYALAELFDSDGSAEFEGFVRYQISPLGYERRGELIRKWVSIGRDETDTTDNLLKTVDEAEQLIESAKIQHIASTVPIYVLSLLQAAASGLSRELHNSSFAHYYYFLIVGALEKAGLSPEQMGPYLSVCTHLSWHIKRFGSSEHKIDLDEFRRFVESYSARWTDTDADSLLKVLVESRLVESDSGYLSFTYPYAYFYFVGRYASISTGDSEVRQYLQFCVEHLYVRECANTLLFLAHHTGNSDVLDHVVEGLRDKFSQRAPAELSRAEAQMLGELLSNAPQVKFKQRSPLQYRREIAIEQDESPATDGLACSPAPGRDLFHDIIATIKALEIAGALLTHQYHNYEKSKKSLAIEEMFDASLRTLAELFGYFQKEPARLIESVASRISNRSPMSRDLAVQEARVQIGLLLRALAAGMLVRAGAHISSENLAGLVSALVTKRNTPAYRLIKISQRLQKPGRFDRAEIERLVRTEAENPCVMGPLQLLVLHRLYMYETDFDDSDWALSTFKLGTSTQRTMELKRQRRLGRN
jgi:hypothetical protein